MKANRSKSSSSGAEDSIRRGDVVTGVLQASARRGGYVVPEAAGAPDVRIPSGGMGAALHSDRVQVTVSRVGRDGKPTGNITRILKHANKQILGQLHRVGRGCVVHPKNPKIHRIVEIHRRIDRDEVPEGAWVVAEIRQWSNSPHEPLVGKLAEVIGVDGDRGLPILLLIRQQGVLPEFPDEVEAEADALRHQPPAATAASRVDFRDRPIFTVDPATAKDFDDAVDLIEKRAGGWRVGVHIADVSHYVRPGSQIDAEARERATSIYPVDRVIPMLPEALSNDLCSLRPDEDKLAMSALFTISTSGAIDDVELCASRIRSVRRFAYEEVQGLFDEADGLTNGDGDGALRHPRPDIPETLRADLMQLRHASRALRAARMERGALDLELPEVEVLFDAEGRVRDLRRSAHFEAHQLIEEFMIAANEAVARTLAARGLPALYRVHAEPDSAGLGTLAPVLSRLGVSVPAKGGLSRQQLQQALNQARRHPAASIIQRWVLRTMQRAKYQPENIGHFGLASDCYLHFTSPIRRYPDLVVHRVVKALLAGEGSGDEGVARIQSGLTEMGIHASAREVRAQRIEWDAEEILSLEFMRRYMGDIFEGFISGVGPMGFYVELVDYPVEGLVRVRDLDDDYYELDEAMAMWRGRSTGRTYGVGDRVTVLIERIDVLAGQMDLILVRKPRGGGKKKKKKKTGKFKRRK